MTPKGAILGFGNSPELEKLMANISGLRLRELERAEAELKRRTERDSMQPFVDLFMSNLAILAASRPMAQWSEQEKAAFHSAAQSIPTGAELYKMALPQ
jgi:hypothetical protein